jgi:hypothetical protein
MSAYRCHLKQPEGWFAAGREVGCALTLLSDSAFKLFLWLCLHALCSRGSVCANPAEIARALIKPEAEIVAGLQELITKGVCRPIHGAVIEIADRFWPYRPLAAAASGRRRVRVC